MTTLKEKIQRDNEKAVKERNASPEWLQTALPLLDSISVHENKMESIKYLYNLMELQNYEFNDFVILLASLSSNTKRPVRLSMSKVSYKKSRYTTASYKMPELVHEMNKKGYIEMKIGYHKKDESKYTRIWASEKLLEYLPEVSNSFINNPKELVHLRDEMGKLIEYKDTPETMRIRSILKQCNAINQSAQILAQNGLHKYRLHTHLVAIYLKKFSLYGRLHTKGVRHYQGLSKEERNQITINGNQTSELDFKALHPMLLYASEGKQYTGDPYLAVHQEPNIRPFLKYVLLCMLNSANRIAAEKAVNYWLYKNHDQRENLKEFGITKGITIIDKFMEVHEPIKHYFCQGKETGLKIMNKDAKIALTIINHFAKQGKPILCIHDSFIVEKEYEMELKQVMKKAYAKHTNGKRIIIK